MQLRALRLRPPLRRKLAAAAAALLLPLGLVLGSCWWIDFSEPPEKADLIVVLAGGFARPIHAAELYKAGYAPEVWLSRPYRGETERAVDALGVRLPREEEVNREILRKLGVPASAIRLYGRDAMSTVNEALALKAEARTRDKRVLVVTSRWHARRSKMIFERELRDAAWVRVTAAEGEPFARRWWTDQAMARMTVLELAKLAYYLIGGRFLSPLEDTPHAF